MKIKEIFFYAFLVFILAFTGVMQCTSYEKVDQLPLLKGEGILWQDITYQEALELSKNKKKLIFIDFYATWCRPCKMLKSVTFTRQSVADIFNSKFINLSIDVDSPKGKVLVQKFNIKSYPTMLFVSSHGQEIARKESFILAPFLLHWAEEIQTFDSQHLTNSTY